MRDMATTSNGDLVCDQVPEAATTNGQDGEDTKRGNQEEELPGVYSHRTTGPYRTSDAWRPNQPEGPAKERHSGRTTDAPDVRPSPEIHQRPNRMKLTEVPTLPDVRSLTSHRTTGNVRTSDACRAQPLESRPMFPFTLLDYIYSSHTYV
jgi:hypothetical protein